MTANALKCVSVTEMSWKTHCSISDGEQVTEKEYVRLLREPIPDQRLSIVQELKPKLKKHVVETLLSGSSKIEPYDTKSQKQPEEEYIMMRKFGLILLKDMENQ